VSRHLSPLLLGLVCFCSALLVTLRFSFVTDISDFIPAGEDRERARLSKAIVSSELSRTLIVAIEAPDTDAAVVASRAFESELANDEALSGQLAFVQGGPPEQIDRALWELYEPRRFAFVEPSIDLARQRVSDAGLEATVADLQARLASPLSTLVSRVAPSDPFLAVPRLLERLGESNPTLAVRDGRFISGERTAIVLLGSEASAFDADAQRIVLAGVKRAFEAVSAEHAKLILRTSGLAKFSVAAEESIKADIQRISTLSIVAMLVLCIALFRSLRLVVLAFVPISCGMLFGTAATLLVFGSIHGLTLAVGASLIGVCLDYVLHFYMHHLVAPCEEGPHRTLRTIWPGLRLGAATTVVGFAALGGSSFPGLRQIAVFASVGIVGALWSTCVLPYLVLARATPRPVLIRLSQRLAVSFASLARRPRIGSALAVASAVAALAGSLTVRWEDDMTQMTSFDPAMHAEDVEVRSKVAQFEQSRFIVALGDDEQSALEVNDRVSQLLPLAQQAGDLDGWQGLGPLLPSASEQNAIFDVLVNAELPKRLGALLEAKGFNRESFEPFFAALAASRPTPLDFEALLDSQAAPLVRSFRVHLDDRVAFVTYLRGVNDVEALQRRVEAVPGALLIDQVGLMRAANESYRTRVVELLWVGLALVFGLLFGRYRDLRMALAAFAPALLASGLTVCALAVLQIPLNLLGLAALLMVLSIGVDYGVFLAETELGDLRVEGADDGRALSATLTALVVAWASTVFGFGVLALSQHPAMRIIGVVAGVGVSACLLLAPVALALAKRFAPAKGRRA